MKIDKEPRQNDIFDVLTGILVILVVLVLMVYGIRHLKSLVEKDTEIKFLQNGMVQKASQILGLPFENLKSGLVSEKVANVSRISCPPTMGDILIQTNIFEIPFMGAGLKKVVISVSSEESKRKVPAIQPLVIFLTRK